MLNTGFIFSFKEFLYEDQRVNIFTVTTKTGCYFGRGKFDEPIRLIVI